MKDFLVTNYKFNKGTIGAGYVEIFEDDFRIDRLISVINQTQGVVLYATGSPTLKFNSVSDKKVYFGVDTSTFSNTDVLQIVYNSSNPLEVIAENTDENLILLRQLARLISPITATRNDSQNSLQVYINGSGVSVNTVAQGSSALPTPISSLLGITNAQDYFYLISKIAFASSLRNQII
ncbi:MAG: hypothetical protein ACK518_00540 [bacterium]